MRTFRISIIAQPLISCALWRSRRSLVPRRALRAHGRRHGLEIAREAGDPVARELRHCVPSHRQSAQAGHGGPARQRYFALASSEGDPRYVGYAQARSNLWDLPTPPLTFS